MARRQGRCQAIRTEVQDGPHRLREHCKRLAVALRNRELVFRRVVDEGKNVLLPLLWKRRLLDTSNALIWMNTPAHLISPKQPVVHCLPLDVLGRIFSFAVHSDCVRPEDRFKKEIWRNFVSSGSSPTSPVVLGHVCRSWRIFVHGSPLLWATIFVHSPVARHVAAVAFWLERSKDCPLDLKFEQFVTPDQPSRDIANLFVAQACRWKRISFVLSIKQFPFQNLNIGDVPLLESFRIRLPRWDRTKCAHVVEVLLSSPALHTINWGKSTFGTLPTSTPWVQLKEISFHNIQLSPTVLSHLALCTNLCALNLHQVQAPVAGSIFPVSLPHLERLVCERSHYGPLNCFTLPKLHELRINTFPCISKPDAPVTSLCDLIERSSCQLQTLEIDSEVISLLPNLILDYVVDLHIRSFSCWHLPSLIVRPGETNILPSLRNLFIGRYDAQDGTLAAVAMSRSNSLRMLCVGIDPEQCPRDNYALGRLKNKEGITVHITEPLYQSQVVSYSRWESADDCDISETSTLRLPDFDTLWT